MAHLLKHTGPGVSSCHQFPAPCIMLCRGAECLPDGRTPDVGPDTRGRYGNPECLHPDGSPPGAGARRDAAGTNERASLNHTHARNASSCIFLRDVMLSAAILYSQYILLRIPLAALTVPRVWSVRLRRWRPPSRGGVAHAADHVDAARASPVRAGLSGGCLRRLADSSARPFALPYLPT